MRQIGLLNRMPVDPKPVGFRVKALAGPCPIPCWVCREDLGQLLARESTAAGAARPVPSTPAIAATDLEPARPKRGLRRVAALDRTPSGGRTIPGDRPPGGT